MERLCLKVDDLLNATEHNYHAIQAVEKKVDEIEKKVDLVLLYTRLYVALLQIDRTKFDVSGLYKDRIYLASKQVAAFSLSGANAECKLQGGYLLEIDDNAERVFTWDFAASIGGAPHFATGGNDEAQEDKWVYYNSGNPVPSDLVWIPGRPNNVGGNEDCLAFWMSRNGLNDIPCNERVKYICEIPLITPTPTSLPTHSAPSS